jgi:nucleoside-diphosphate-sugar epimerase
LRNELTFIQNYLMEYPQGITSGQGAPSPGRNKTIIVAGATGALGSRIVGHLLKSGATVKALLRRGSNPAALAPLQAKGALVTEVDFHNPEELIRACAGGTSLVSALSGVEDVIVGVQMQLLQAALAAGIPRFIPSDYCIDYTKLPYGSNRNLDLRRRFNERLDEAPIAATSILNGMFTELLTGQAPVILFGLKRVVYWGDAGQLMDFTTIENTAEFTALAALDDTTPRYLRIAGEVTNIKGLRDAATEVTGKMFHLLRAGGLGGLQTMIKITRTLLPKKEEVFPPWQGMQYLHNMFTGLPKLEPLNNDRYPQMQWTTVKQVLATRTVT